MHIRIVVLLVSLLASASAFAQNLRVVPVPWMPTDLSVPHAAYNGHATTFKAIARGGNGTYQYEWDFQGDGVYDFSATTNNRYNLSTRFTYPNQAVTTTFTARVRVTSNGQTVTQSYPVRVYADVPPDPAAANARQLQIMRSVAIDDGLWFLHNELSRTGNEEDPLYGAQATGDLMIAQGAYRNTIDALYLEALARQGHRVAFPAAYVGSMPDPAANTQRFRDDPYAEDAMRLLNQLLTQSTPVAVSSADESNFTGFYPETARTPLPGTDDGIGLSTSSSQTGPLSGIVRALAVSKLTGYIAQTGDANRILGRPFEFLLQQYVDALVWAQNESTVPGSWYYTPNAANDLLGELGDGTMDAAEALATAEESMGADGVIVPNLVKARLLQYVQQDLNTCPAGGTGGTINASYNGVCDFANSAAILFALRWVGAHSFDPSDTRLAFPSYNGLTRANLRGWYNSTLTFISTVFNATSVGAFSWDNGFIEGGNWGRIDGLADHYSMVHWARAARVGSPEVVNFGNNDWQRLFSQYLINNQAPGGSWNWVQSTTLNNYNDQAFGPDGRAGWALLTAIGDSRAPFIIGQANLQTAAEGDPLDFTSKAEAAGTVVWAFGNGATANGANVTYAYPDNGMFNATVTLTTPDGQVSVDTIPVTITSVAPTANAGADVTADEGTTIPLSGTFTDPGTADTFTFAWNFGDNTTGNTQNVNKKYADNGVYTATFRVTDDDGATSVDSLTVTINNVAPTITSTAPGTAAEGTAYTYTLTFTDPGTADTHTCALETGPSNATVTNCSLSWTPTGAQSAKPQAFKLCVTDDDGGKTCQQWSLTAAPIDVDQDGLPDSWETSYFGNITAADQFGDLDADGMNNLQEFNAGTDPTIFEGVGTPSMQLPACNSTVATARPTLTVANAPNGRMTQVTYSFELYSDSSLTQFVAADANVTAGTSTTSWQPPVLLLENRTYFWRARASDATMSGAWTSTCAFTVNVTDELPSAPQLDTPDVGATVSSLTPTLTVRNSIDPDGDALTYEFEVRNGDTVLASAQSVVETNGTTSWQVTPALPDGTEYRWRARATSATGSSPWSTFSRFVVNTAAQGPLEAPIILSPQNGTVVATLTPTLSFAGSGKPSAFDWQLATDATFNTVVASGEDSQSTRIQLAQPLTEDGAYCWRVRADDGASQSSWVKACFTASAEDGAPSVPTLVNPGNDSVVTTLTPLFNWAAAVDPEGKPLTYELELSEAGAVIATITGIGGTTALASAPLTDGHSYSWRVRALTGAQEPASAFSAANTFRVELPKSEAPVAPASSGCGCGATSPSSLIPFALLAFVLLLRRRRVELVERSAR